MIDNTRKKLREAQFFLAKLEGENHKVVRAEPEAFDFYYRSDYSGAGPFLSTHSPRPHTRDRLTKRDQVRDYTEQANTN